ncbi:MAG: SpoIIE family protein phosphatase [Anaerolineae bacterium]|jgi:serine phosphatase RsbU (regulator of sigma subunit)|nr:SpoIIE family protein phosphatase [Anaerolineae bacterium]MDH7474127.1 SpoIIE family protein phosphatase [Anaerolineae bacterium]
MNMGAMALLARVFRGLDQNELAKLVALTVEREFPAGAVICQEHAIEHSFYVIAEGRVEIVKSLGEDEVQLYVRGPGEFFGEMALIENAPRSATVRALEPCCLLEVDEAVFDRILADNPAVALDMMRGLSTTIRETDVLTIEGLRRKNEELARAYAELKAAQAQIVEKERLERELEIAGEVQRGILPKSFPEVPGLNFAARYLPAREVGGDFYDAFLLDEGQVGLVMADVSGKSVHAAIFMAVTRALMVAQAHVSRSPQKMLLDVHDFLLHVSSADMFVTVFYGILDARTQELRYVRAGHDRPIFYCGGTGEVSLLEGHGRFLGMIEDDPDLEERSLRLRPGDLLVLYSDGLTDAVNSSGERYGVQRLMDSVTAWAGKPATGICDAVFDQVLAFQGETRQFDDMALMVVQVL